jgi:hypothetical protein
MSAPCLILPGLIVILLVYLIYRLAIIDRSQYSVSKSKFDDTSYLTCYLKLGNINPKFVNNYAGLDGKKIKCGTCENGILRVKVEPCEISTDDGNYCSQYAQLTTSDGLEIPYKKDVSPSDITNYFCLD